MKEENPGQKVEDVNTHHNNETPSTGAEWQTVADQERKRKSCWSTYTHRPEYILSLCAESHKDPLGTKRSNSGN